MLKHKILIQKKKIKLTPMSEDGFGKMKIVAGFPEKSKLTYKTALIENKVDLVEKECAEIEEILKKALDDIEEVIIKKQKKYFQKKEKSKC